MSGTTNLCGFELEHRGSNVIVRFSRPEIRNPLSRPVLLSLNSLLDQFSSTLNPTALIFTGSDNVFASGADIRDLAELDEQLSRTFSQFGQQTFEKIVQLRPLTIAAVNGYCMGGALDLALACDVRIASSSAIFAHPGAQLGIITGWGGTQRLPKLIGTARAAEMFFTARRVDAEEALRIGLVSEVFDPVLDCALKIAACHGRKFRKKLG
jgi:enoyl-CoA hydratase